MGAARRRRRGRAEAASVLGRVGVGDVLPRTADDPRDAGLAEHEPRPLVGIVRVDGHVRGTRREDAEDREVELLRARGDAHPDPVTTPNARLVQAGGGLADARHELRVAQRPRAVVDRGGLRVPCRGGAEHVDECARRRCLRRRGREPAEGPRRPRSGEEFDELRLRQTRVARAALLAGQRAKRHDRQRTDRLGQHDRGRLLDDLGDRARVR